ncbi:MAG TPA: molecular chaperone DnaJ [Pirellulales bacterium]|nr:molecular chaperone DnaJ [Pirellulales bacterium]
MAGKRDYYEVLEIERSASGNEIATAYRKLAIKYHPDKNPGDEEAVGRFKECAEAFEVLNDPDKRARYDRYGHAGVDGPGGGSPHFTDINDVFEAFGDIFGDGVFGDIFGRGGGRGRGRGRRARRGGDVRADVTLDLIEAARGVSKQVRIERHERCSDCQGSGAKSGSSPEKCRYCGGAGQVIQTTGIFRVQTTCPSCHGAGSVIKDRCPSCGGEGLVKRRVEREVRIPAGVDNEMRLRLTGEGNHSPDGGPPGDCYCFIALKEHALFHREGRNLICPLPVTYSQAALGATLEVPTLEGRDELQIPAGTQPGEVFKLRGRGMPDLQHRGKGDLLVQIHLEVPKSLNARQEELLRELAEEEHRNVSAHRKSFFEKLKDYFIPDESNQEGE